MKCSIFVVRFEEDCCIAVKDLYPSTRRSIFLTIKHFEILLAVIKCEFALIVRVIFLSSRLNRIDVYSKWKMNGSALFRTEAWGRGRRRGTSEMIAEAFDMERERPYWKNETFTSLLHLNSWKIARWDIFLKRFFFFGWGGSNFFSQRIGFRIADVLGRRQLEVFRIETARGSRFPFRS